MLWIERLKQGGGEEMEGQGIEEEVLTKIVY